jgi:hypothetical protein
MMVPPDLRPVPCGPALARVCRRGVGTATSGHGIVDADRSRRGGVQAVALAVVAFAVGAVAGWIAVMVGYIVYVEAFDVFDREGAMAMGAAFGIGPVAGVALGIAAAVWAVGRLRRGEDARTGAAPPRRARWQRVLLFVALPGLAVYYAVAIALWLAGPASYETYWAALAASLAPLVTGVAAALLGWRYGMRRAPA